MKTIGTVKTTSNLKTTGSEGTPDAKAYHATQKAKLAKATAEVKAIEKRREGRST